MTTKVTVQVKTKDGFLLSQVDLFEGGPIPRRRDRIGMPGIGGTFVIHDVFWDFTGPIIRVTVSAT